MENSVKANPGLRRAIIHSDRGSQYTGQAYKDAVCKYDIRQRRNSAGRRCHDNARCESMWARMKSEPLYIRYETEKMTAPSSKRPWNNAGADHHIRVAFAM